MPAKLVINVSHSPKITEAPIEKPTKPSFKDILLGDSISKQPHVDALEGLFNEDSYVKGPNTIEGVSEIYISKAEHKRLCQLWKKAFIIKLLCKNLGPNIIKFQICRLWKPTGNLVMSDLGNHFLVVRLTNEHDYEKAMYGGPWLISNHYFTVQPWCPDFDTNMTLLSRLAVWIRVPQLTGEFFTKECLVSIGNLSGQTMSN